VPLTNQEHRKTIFAFFIILLSPPPRFFFHLFTLPKADSFLEQNFAPATFYLLPME
jgi:hypothetical protein